MKKQHIFLLSLQAVLLFVLSVLLLTCCSSVSSQEFSMGDASVNSSFGLKSAVMSESYDGDMAIAESIRDDFSVSSDRKLIQTITLSMETTDFDSTNARIPEKATELGGYVESSSIRGQSMESSNTHRRANFTVRIPSDRVTEFLEESESYGNVVSKEEQISDVTDSYSDTESHIAMLREEQSRLMELFEQADTVETIIQIEDKLTDVKYEIESYERQKRNYDSRIAYTSIAISVTEVQLYTEVEKAGVFERISVGFQKNLVFLKNLFVNAFVFIISHLPTLILCGGILGVIIYRILKRFWKKPPLS